MVLVHFRPYEFCASVYAIAAADAFNDLACQAKVDRRKNGEWENQRSDTTYDVERKPNLVAHFETCAKP
ncbi:MAG: hypothetical protein OEW16_07385 [Gammaproteobacteria bacterium]|nr:hypothetical protein [Gammaproteobacteria bacterium]